MKVAASANAALLVVGVAALALTARLVVKTVTVSPVARPPTEPVANTTEILFVERGRKAAAALLPATVATRNPTAEMDARVVPVMRHQKADLVLFTSTPTSTQTLALPCSVIRLAN